MTLARFNLHALLLAALLASSMLVGCGGKTKRGPTPYFIPAPQGTFHAALDQHRATLTSKGVIAPFSIRGVGDEYIVVDLLVIAPEEDVQRFFPHAKQGDLARFYNYKWLVSSTWVAWGSGDGNSFRVRTCEDQGVPILPWFSRTGPELEPALIEHTRPMYDDEYTEVQSDGTMFRAFQIGALVKCD